MPETFYTPFPEKVFDYNDFSVKLEGYVVRYTNKNAGWTMPLPTNFQITETSYGMLTIENTFMRFTDVLPHMREQMFRNIAKIFDLKL
jgi:hypothetical protein